MFPIQSAPTIRIIVAWVSPLLVVFQVNHRPTVEITQGLDIWGPYTFHSGLRNVAPTMLRGVLIKHGEHVSSMHSGKL